MAIYGDDFVMALAFNVCGRVTSQDCQKPKPPRQSGASLSAMKNTQPLPRPATHGISKTLGQKNNKTPKLCNAAGVLRGRNGCFSVQLWVDSEHSFSFLCSWSESVRMLL